MLSLGADLRAFSRRVARGNEDGRIADDDPERADLSVPGYAIVDLRAAWRLARGVELVARVDNVFDRRFFNEAALGSTLFDANGAYTGDARRALFVAPGAPRAAFAGLRLRY
jgi:outer membrane receptor protein involved in Fe transport